jgi:hypothetical protein
MPRPTGHTASLSIDELVSLLPEGNIEEVVLTEELRTTLNDVSRELMWRTKWITPSNPQGQNRLNHAEMSKLKSHGFYVIGYSVEGEKGTDFALRHRPTGFIAALRRVY